MRDSWRPPEAYKSQEESRQEDVSGRRGDMDGERKEGEGKEGAKVPDGGVETNCTRRRM